MVVSRASLCYRYLSVLVLVLCFVLFCSRHAVKMASGPGSSRRCCVNSPDCFCYICGCYVIQRQKSNITSFVKKAYYTYFKVKLGDQDKGWAPHVVCSTCVKELRHWYIKVHAHPRRLVYRWSGVNHKITTMTVTFACAMCRGTTKKISGN
jgi:hypothetical protein